MNPPPVGQALQSTSATRGDAVGGRLERSGGECLGGCEKVLEGDLGRGVRRTGPEGSRVRSWRRGGGEGRGGHWLDVKFR